MSYFPTYETRTLRSFESSKGQRFMVVQFSTKIRKPDDRGRMFTFGHVEEFEINAEYYNEHVMNALGNMFINTAYQKYLTQRFVPNVSLLDSDQSTEIERSSKYNLELLEKYVKKTK